MANKGMPTKKRATNREVMEKLSTIEGKVGDIDPDRLLGEQGEMRRQIEEIQQALIRVVNQWDFQLNYHRNALAEVISRVDLITGSIGESVPPAEQQPAIFPMKEEETKETPAPEEEETPASDEEASQPPPSE